VQLLCPDLHPVDAVASVSPQAAGAVASSDPSLGERVTKLEAEVAELRATVRRLTEALGVSNAE
jgi:hypothetical protein